MELFRTRTAKLWFSAIVLVALIGLFAYSAIRSDTAGVLVAGGWFIAWLITTLALIRGTAREHEDGKRKTMLQRCVPIAICPIGGIAIAIVIFFRPVVPHTDNGPSKPPGGCSQSWGCFHMNSNW